MKISAAIQTLLVLGASITVPISLVQAAPQGEYSLEKAFASSFSSHRYNAKRLCGTHISAERKASVERKFAAQRIAAPETAKAVAPVIDVYFNVIAANKTIAGGWIPAHQIKSQIAVLNRDFKSTGVQYRLAKVTRYISKRWFNGVAPEGAMQTEMKQKLRKGGPETLNVYTVGFHNTQAEGLLGHATFPTDYKSLPKDDGVVIQYGTLPGGNLAPFNKGKTLTHEVGHWVGLYHTFEGGSCSSSGDEVSDTPAQLKPTSGCPIANPDTCPGKAGLDPIRALISIAFKFYGNNGSDRQLYGLLG
uniref:Peptidase M43 pregnancy-associated plasma-A domain-containing protein n=1 Tax=Psilocybe cubensis TaxID=181762 RepID=A0A8H8CR92_PSICU